MMDLNVLTNYEMVVKFINDNIGSLDFDEILNMLIIQEKVFFNNIVEKVDASGRSYIVHYNVIWYICHTITMFQKPNVIIEILATQVHPYKKIPLIFWDDTEVSPHIADWYDSNPSYQVATQIEWLKPELQEFAFRACFSQNIKIYYHLGDSDYVFDEFITKNIQSCADPQNLINAYKSMHENIVKPWHEQHLLKILQ